MRKDQNCFYLLFLFLKTGNEINEMNEMNEILEKMFFIVERQQPIDLENQAKQEEPEGLMMLA